jgi:phosphate/sulfate permease
MGIGLYKGAGNINFRLLRDIAIGWISTPILSGLITFFSLFFIKNVFNIDVGHKVADGAPQGVIPVVATDINMSLIIKYLLVGILVSGIMAIAYFLLLEKKKARELSKSEERFWKNMK